ncbi:DNA replication ATP-dependent helicase/nuclease DNA2 isoform X2 [Paramormyrops kingsleyae]|uniref:DNA replication ATP-dependent helicase/nuclease DNA2 isoform X2 n=1 Tax=Paramormyrops kingsleyae TaxID=1676925 RepID=UPI000CD5EAD1|nr:DNA replication ATP-dependent helicase/nuclease DNA2 isoform X2 [Paramormyrops kingsleyae]
MIAGNNQRQISAFFSGGATGVPSALKNKCTAERMQSRVNPTKLHVQKESDPEGENLPPSPYPSCVPETPDSQIRTSLPVPGHTSKAQVPVPCSLRSQAFGLQKPLTARRFLLSPRGWRTPLGPASLGSHNGGVVSMRRLLSDFGGVQKNVQSRPLSDGGTPVLRGDSAFGGPLMAVRISATTPVKRKSSEDEWDAEQKHKPVPRQDRTGGTPEPVHTPRKGVLPLQPIQTNREDDVFSLLDQQLTDTGSKSHSGAPDGGEGVPRGSEGDHLHMPLSGGSLGDTCPSSNSDMAASEDALTCLEDLLQDDSFWSDDKMEADQLDANKLRAIPDDVILSNGLHNRYWVLDVQEVVSHKGDLEKHLKITASKIMYPTESCVLKEGWESTPVAIGDIVHLEGESDRGSWFIGRDSGFLILQPDVLISCTSISSSIRCMRRAVLSERFKAFDGSSMQMLNGTMVHEIFQKAATSGGFHPQRLQQLLEEALLGPAFLREMYSLKLSQANMRQKVEEYLPSLGKWASDYLASSAQAGKKQLMLKLPGECNQGTACHVTVTDFVDIEENIWSPRLGLKGKIDVTSRVQIQRQGRHQVWRQNWEGVVPLELKTGRETNSIEHRSQVILYNLMSSERRGATEMEAGFLLYLKTGSMHAISGTHMDKRELLKLRNTLAYHLISSVQHGGAIGPRLAPLPNIVMDQQACRFCPQKRNCALYSRAVEGGKRGSCGSQPPFMEAETRHLRDTHLHYFAHWLLLCSLEAEAPEGRGHRRGIWLQEVQEREVHGCCMGDLVRVGEAMPTSDHMFAQRFRRRGTGPVRTGLSVGDGVLVSRQDKRLFAVAKGFVMDVAGDGGVLCKLNQSLSASPGNAIFRLDQDEGEKGLHTHLGNLSKLMENSMESERLRDIIIDLRPPCFFESLSSVLPQDVKDTVASILKGLNKTQKQAMKKVLLSKDYTVIVGMPGSGKTTTICSLVRILHACGFSVLLTSYTHSAVDNILVKLLRFRVGFLRLGRTHKVHTDVQPYTEEWRCASGVRTLAELEQLYNSELVVATTCMGVRHPLFSRRRFDFCIVDEASQISQLVCLGPLFYTERFVLVGDQQQLAPIVRSRQARDLGMDESLLKRLERHSNAVVELNLQYRMNSGIMSLSNMLMYGGKLECGSERTARAMLELPTWGTVEQELELSLSRPEYLAWIRAALEPQKPVCFLDTAKVPALETATKGGISNPNEAILVHGLVSLLLKAGCSAEDIGIIAPYRQQLAAISGLLSSPAFSAVEVNTVDKYQGRDKNVIIVSFVRSNTQGRTGELLKDWRRLNVAVTRAKRKLLLLGSAPTLKLFAPLEKLLCHLERTGDILLLPLAAHQDLSRMCL